MTAKPYPQLVLIRLSEVSDVGTSTAHRTAYVTTTLQAIAQGLRNLECQPDPFNEFQGPDALFARLLAGIVGTTEYDAVMGNDLERLNALLAEQVERVATLTRERDEARAKTVEALASIDAFMGESMPWTDPSGAAYTEQLGEIASRRLQYTLDTLLTTPTPGAQA